MSLRVVFSYQRATEPSIPIPLYPFAIVFAIWNPQSKSLLLNKILITIDIRRQDVNRKPCRVACVPDPEHSLLYCGDDSVQPESGRLCGAAPDRYAVPEPAGTGGPNDTGKAGKVDGAEHGRGNGDAGSV